MGNSLAARYIKEDVESVVEMVDIVEIGGIADNQDREFPCLFVIVVCFDPFAFQ
jgi:hypothetical protein